MTPSEIILLVLEIIGTVAFAVSGAFAAIKAKLDIFGVLFIGCITAVGGGITRDLLIGDTPPKIFDSLHILAIAATSALVVFVAAYLSRKQFLITYEHFEPIQNVFDAFGLAAFSVTGTEIAFSSGLAENPVLAILLGVLTGVGGGVFRDVLTSTTPYIFKKHVYALASIGGASVYYVMRSFVETETPLIPSLVAMVLVVAVRLLAAKYRWSLPKVKLEEGE